MDEGQNQGLQVDGNSPEPSQNLEGNVPVPSQEDTGQLTDQELQDMLPEQDDRGVPAKNVLSEALRKIDKLTETVNNLQSAQYQQPQPFQQPYQQPNYQQQVPKQQEQIIPNSADEVADIIDRECRDKFGAAFTAGTADYWEIERFRDKRRTELSQAMLDMRIKSVETNNVLKTERERSFARIVGLYPDLNSIQSPLTQTVFNEVNRRASLMGVSPQTYLERDPYVIESIAPLAAAQLGINAKAQGQPRIVPRQPNLPPNNFPGRQTKAKEGIKPTQDEVDFGKRFGIKPESLAKAKQKSSDEGFVDESGLLYS